MIDFWLKKILMPDVEGRNNDSFLAQGARTRTTKDQDPFLLW